MESLLRVLEPIFMHLRFTWMHHTYFLHKAKFIFCIVNGMKIDIQVESSQTLHVGFSSERSHVVAEI